MMPVLELGGPVLQTRGLVTLLGLLAALWLTEIFARRRGLDTDLIWNAGLLGLLTTSIGARLAYAAQHPTLYAAEPLGLFSLSFQSLAWEPGVLIGLLTVWVMLRSAGAPLAETLDAAAPGAALFAAAAGLGALLSGDAYGLPVGRPGQPSLPWAIFLWNEMRHPVQAYETLLALATAGLLGWLWFRRPYPGWLTGVAVALLAGGRLFVEGFRADPATLLGGIRVAQVWSLVLVLSALFWLSRKQRHVAAPLAPVQMKVDPDELADDTPNLHPTTSHRAHS